MTYSACLCFNQEVRNLTPREIVASDIDALLDWISVLRMSSEEVLESLRGEFDWEKILDFNRLVNDVPQWSTQYYADSAIIGQTAKQSLERVVQELEVWNGIVERIGDSLEELSDEQVQKLREDESIWEEISDCLSTLERVLGRAEDEKAELLNE